MNPLRVHPPGPDGHAAAAQPALKQGRGPGRQLLRASRACRLCDVSLATWWRWDAAGKIPSGIKLSAGIKRWRREELESWVRAGCPDRKTWEALKENGRR